MLHQYTINDVNNQPSILKYWLTKPIDNKPIIKQSIIKNNTISRPKI